MWLALLVHNIYVKENMILSVLQFSHINTFPTLLHLHPWSYITRYNMNYDILANSSAVTVFVKLSRNVWQWVFRAEYTSGPMALTFISLNYLLSENGHNSDLVLIYIAKAKMAVTELDLLI